MKKKAVCFLIILLVIVSFSSCSSKVKKSSLENHIMSIEGMDTLLNHSLSYCCSSLDVEEKEIVFDDWNSGTVPGTYSFFSLEGTLILDFDIQDTYHQKVYAIRFIQPATALDQKETGKKYKQLYDEIVKDYGEATSKLFFSGETDSDYWELTRNQNEALLLSIFLDSTTEELVIKYGYKKLP